VPQQENAQDPLKQLTSELANFEEITKSLLPRPGDEPQLRGIDIWGGTLALNGVGGGDHLIYVDFKQCFDLRARIEQEERPEVIDNLERCEKTTGIALIDVAGHRATDAVLSAMLHQAFLLGAIYELDMFGQITRRLFEHLNTQFYKSSGAHKFVSLIYGEISEDARFRFLSAAQPFPLVFSNRHNRFMEVGPDRCVSFPPLGMMPSLYGIDRNTTGSLLGFKDHYQINEWMLMGEGDILLMHTDGLVDHENESESYVPSRLEKTLRDAKRRTAPEIFEAITNDLLAFGPATDDISLVVIKRT
jgi:serine phosphatase RsbU (regulator of sigma subunit)